MQNFTAADKPIWFAIILAAIAVSLTALSFLHIGYGGGYERGQLDALNGKQTFEMQVRPDTLYIQKPE